MAVLGTLHFDQQQLSKQQIGAACKQAVAAYGYYPFLTNTTVGSSDTNAGLQTAVNTAAAALHADNRYAAPRVNLGITLGLYSTELSDARILGLTTTAGLVALTYADSLTVGGGSQPPE
jgi:hypothetical protein